MAGRGRRGTLVLAAPASAQAPQSRFADVNGVRLHYWIAGRGEPVLLLHGYAETSHMWRPLIKELARTRTVIAPDLRGFGASSEADRRLHQGDDGAGRPCADGEPRAAPQRGGRP
jgi:pimeloyl-ACP methyl ester carboxylesterase